MKNKLNFNNPFNQKRSNNQLLENQNGFKITGKKLLLIVLLIYILLSTIIELDFFFFLEIPEGLKIIVNTYFPPKFENIASLNNIIHAIWETLVIASAASLSGALIAIILTLLAINDMKVNIFAILSKTIASITRCIPSYIYGALLVTFLWRGEFVAWIAITIGSTGFLIRAFGEVMKSNGKDSIEALKATGATNWQIITRAIIPGALPLLFSWTLYTFESNVRSSTIIGLIAQMGLGGLFVTAGNLPGRVYPFRTNYQMAIIVTISILVIIINMIVTKIRGRLLKWS